MLASNDLPDVIYNNWLGFPGGPEKAILDKVIIPLNDIIAKHAPNLAKRFVDRPDWAKAAKSDMGTLYMFPFIRGHDSLMVFFGPILRKDWLDELGLPVPETMDEWYKTLTAFKAKTGGMPPLSMTAFGKGRDIRYGAFISAYETAMGFYQLDGKVRFGQMDPGYKEFLATFNKWFAEGLIDKEFMTNDMAAFNAKVLGNRAGAFPGFTGSTMGTFFDAKKDDPKFNLVGAPYPVLKKGQTAFTGQRDNPANGMGYAISTKSKDPALAASWIDYNYGKEGHMLFNFGIEGESYTMINGYPTYTDSVKKHPNGMAVALAGIYARSSTGGAFVQDERYFQQYVARPQQQNAVNVWSKTRAVEHNLPGITPTPEESQRLAAIMNEVNTYCDEMFVKFIVGAEPIANYDQFIAQLKRMKIEDAIAIQQAALDRYNKR
jgi:putative aldouronate transport system substrate-binding protein